MNRKTVLIVCMFDSIHSARWLNQFADEHFDFIIFPSSPHRRVHPDLKKLIRYSGPATYRLLPFTRMLGLPLWILDFFFDDWLRGTLVRRYIQKLRPGYVHALELQNAGYVCAKAFNGVDTDATEFICSNWGSDIYWFQQFPHHKEKLRDLLRLATVYSAECARDVLLARKLGFEGRIMPVTPNAGGLNFDIVPFDGGATPPRTSIAVKGYDGWAGEAKKTLLAIADINREISHYKIEIFSCNVSVIRLAKKIARETGLDIVCYRKGSLSHAQVLQLLARSAIHVGVSKTDGISTSMLEAMACGAIPVQTNTACCNEWFHGSGVSINSINVAEIGEAVLEGLRLSRDPNNARQNWETVRDRASFEAVREKALLFYAS